MNTKYIKLRVLSPGNPAHDQDAHFRADQITKVFSVPIEKKKTKETREEVNAFIETANGFNYQTAEKPETIFERLSEAEIMPFQRE
jgi:hypothetical protein